MSDAIYPKGYKAKPDNEKTNADWEIHEAITDWQQAAFNAHWYECSKFLDASEGGKQTSNDLHMLCQGYALAAARITELETALAEMTEDRDLWKQSEAVASEQFDKAEGRVIADVVAWLRDGGRKDAADLRRLHANKKLSPAMTEEWETLIQTKAGIATALETGGWKK